MKPEELRQIIIRGRENSEEGLKRAAGVVQIPSPEVVNRLAEKHEIPKSAAGVAGLADRNGWTVRVTYARGPHLHTGHWTVLRIVDSVAVRMARGPLRAVGCWMTNGKGKHQFDFGLVATERGYRRTDFPELKAFISAPITEEGAA